MLKLAGLLLGGNSLKLSSQCAIIGTELYIRKFCSRSQSLYLMLSSPLSNGSALRSKYFGTRISDSGARQTSMPVDRCSEKTTLNLPARNAMHSPSSLQYKNPLRGDSFSLPERKGSKL